VVWKLSGAVDAGGCEDCGGVSASAGTPDEDVGELGDVDVVWLDCDPIPGVT
jgi:hypothetical protein